MKNTLFSIVLFLGLIFNTLGQNIIKVACVGNSITQGPGREHPDSYPLQLQALLGENYQVKNFGVSGRTLLKKGDFPYWNEPQFQEVKDFQPDILVIKLGTNDSKPQNWVYKADFKKDYLELIASIKAHMPSSGKVYICIPVPVTKDNFGIRESIMVNEVQPFLLEIAKESGASIIDLYTPLKDRADLLPDGVHPNKEGLGIMAREVAKAIQ
ncbi:GDSL-type esterase/lipase family protein [Cecembia calidifontis]|jgi:lysophospholipase L1-like esterase|uniref:Lysophospholipase L1-like esterase n=1 Tax=Cecembia calidifontis TaxID=1187080 RepID=A0A4Q7P5L1_9BACT|nr:GDSL-type esterase/lipase family protein [Cecembia calidifontis]RZS95017.1 lysophospholipase L1-like esterase [Cecembia calidifontis]